MKKILALILTLVLALSMVACGSDAEPEVKDDGATKATEATSDNDSTEPTDDSNDESDEPVADIPETDAVLTVGEMLESKFLEVAGSMTAEEIANELIAIEDISSNIMLMATPVEDYFPGFDNYEITGFDTAVNFMPMIGSIAFVGYVFELPSDADAGAFVTELEENCNPRWNICVEAEQTTTAIVDNMVLFAMTPLTFETNEEEVSDDFGDFGDDFGYEDDAVADEEVPAYDGEELPAYDPEAEEAVVVAE